MQSVTFSVRWENEWVSVTLQPGQEAHFDGGHQTAEGYTARHEAYTYEADKDRVFVEIMQDDKDAKGHFTSYTDLYCKTDRLCVINGRPDWVELEKVVFNENERMLAL